MSTIQPSGDALKKAIRWISDKRKENEDINLGRLVDEAGFQFDLSPRDAEFLLRFVKDNDHDQDPS